jgi:hypothetical protein
MALHAGPENKDPNEFQQLKINAFKLHEHVYRTVYKVLTRLPTEETLLSLEKLPPYIAKLIKNCIEQLYSHVTLRKPDEGSVYFFHHVAASVHYERYTQTLIKERNHALKASTIVNMLEKTLKEIEARLKKMDLANPLFEILILYQAILIVHKHAINEALKTSSDHTKAHLLEYEKKDVDRIKVIPLTPTKKQAIEASYPVTPLKDKGTGTPKRLTESDKVSIESLKRVQKKLFEDVVVQELDDSSEDEEKPLNVDLYPYLEATPEEDFEDELSRGVDALLFNPFLARKGITAFPAQSEPLPLKPHRKKI